MTTKRIITAVLAAGIFSAAGISAAATSGSGSVSVTGSLKQTCTEKTSGVFSALLIDPSTGLADTAADTDEAVQCTKSGTYGITLSDARHATADIPCDSTGHTGLTLFNATANPSSLPFTLKCTSAAASSGSLVGLGFSGDNTKNISLGLKINISQSDAALADLQSGNNYADTVTVTLSY